MKPLNITNAQFLEDICAKTNATKQGDGAPGFSWFDGSGVGVRAGIPLWRERIDRLLKTTFKQRCPFAKDSDYVVWVNETFGHLPGFSLERAANFLPFIIQECFRHDPTGACREIEQYSSAQPSVGHIIQAVLMTGTSRPNHRLALTTCDDNLLFTAITMYMGDIPVQCGYESFMSYAVSDGSKRPVIGKLQRDLVLSPKLSVSEIEAQPTLWKEAIDYVFETTIPIFKGFGDIGGSGGSIMPYLKDVKPAKNGMFWLYQESSSFSKPSREVQEVVERLGGQCVPVLGYDEVMLELWEVLSLTSLESELRERSERLIRLYREGFLGLARSLSRLGENGSVTAKTTKASAQRAYNRWLEDERL